MGDWIKKAMGTGWTWTGGNQAAAAAAATPALQLQPDEAFRMWHANWRKEEPARPAIALAEHGIHMPHLDRCLWEHVVLPLSLEERVPLPSLGEPGDPNLKADQPTHGLWWPLMFRDQEMHTGQHPVGSLAGRVFLVFSSEDTDSLRLWLDACEYEMTNRTAHPGDPEPWEFRLVTLAGYAKSLDVVERLPLEHIKHTFKTAAKYDDHKRTVVVVRPPDVGHHAPYQPFLMQLRRHCHSFYVRVPPRPDRLRFLRHLNAQLARSIASHLAYLLPSSDQEMLVDDALVQEMARSTPFYHYSDLARLLLRTVEQWQRDQLCGRHGDISLETRLRLTFCAGGERNAQQRALQEERREEATTLDRFFALPEPLPRGAGDNTLGSTHSRMLSDEQDVVQLLEAEFTSRAHALEALRQAQSPKPRREQRQETDGERERPRKRARLESSGGTSSNNNNNNNNSGTLTFTYGRQ